MKTMLLKEIRNRGFTLIELLVTLAIIAIITAVVVPNFTGSQRRAKDDNAIARGSVLDLAKTSLLQEGGAAAQTAWDNANGLSGYPPDDIATPTSISAKDEAKYDLLRPYLSAPPNELGCGLQAGQYSPTGYWYHLNGLNDPTTIWRRIDGQSIGGDGTSDRVVLNLIANPSNGGSVSGAGSYPAGSPRTIKAQEFQEYSFANWSNGSAERVTTVTLPSSGSMTVTANFNYVGADQVTLNILSSVGGTTNPVAGTYTYAKGATVTITASPASGYSGNVNWSNGATGSSVSLTLNDNTTIRATFQPLNHSVSLATSDANMGTVSGGGSYPHGSNATVNATSKSGFKFTGWVVTSGALPSGFDINNSVNSFTVNADVSFRANFAVDPGQYYSFTLQSADATKGTVQLVSASTTPVGGKYSAGTVFDIKGIPSSSYIFQGWSGGTGGTFVNAFLETTKFTLGAVDTKITANFNNGGNTPGPGQLVSEVGLALAGDGRIRGISDDEKQVWFQSDNNTLKVFSTTTGALIQTFTRDKRWGQWDYWYYYYYGFANEMLVSRDCKYVYERQAWGTSNSPCYRTLSYLDKRNASTGARIASVEIPFYTSSNWPTIYYFYGGSYIATSTLGDYIYVGVGSYYWPQFPNYAVVIDANSFQNVGTKTLDVVGSDMMSGYYGYGDYYGYPYAYKEMSATASTTLDGTRAFVRTISSYYSWYYLYQPISSSLLEVDTSSGSVIQTLDTATYPTDWNQSYYYYYYPDYDGKYLSKVFYTDTHISNNGVLYVTRSGLTTAYRYTPGASLQQLLTYPASDSYMVLTNKSGAKVYMVSGQVEWMLNYNSYYNFDKTLSNTVLKIYNAPAGSPPEAKMYTVSVTPNNSAWGSVNPTTAQVVQGGFVILQATPATNYQFDKWVDLSTGTSLSQLLTYKLQNVQADTNIRADFMAQYVITAQSANISQGTVTPASQLAIRGNNVTVTATALAGYKFDKWVDSNGSTVSTSATYTFSASRDTSLTANFTVMPPSTITVTNYSGAVITVNPNPVSYGGSTILTASFAIYWYDASWHYLGYGTTYTLSNVRSNTTIIATFE